MFGSIGRAGLGLCGISDVLPGQGLRPWFEVSFWLSCVLPSCPLESRGARTKRPAPKRAQPSPSALSQDEFQVM